MTAPPRLLVTRRLPAPVEERLGRAFDARFNSSDRPLSPLELAEALRSFDAVLPTITDRIDAAMLNASGVTARMLANFGAGVEHIDIAAARAAGIGVSNTPGALTEATADLAILLILMAARRAGEGERELRGGQWSGWRPTHMLGQGLQGRVLGLLGFGRIARATATRAAAFGMRMVYHSRSAVDPEVEARFAATRVGSIELLADQADILSLHVPGGADTRHLVDARLLARMKPGAILINTARGSIVDEAALADALASRRIAAAGLDVFEREPAVHPALAGLENAVLLPHLGSATIEARTAMGMQAADNLDAFFSGRELPNRVC